MPLLKATAYTHYFSFEWVKKVDGLPQLVHDGT